MWASALGTPCEAPFERTFEEFSGDSFGATFIDEVTFDEMLDVSCVALFEASFKGNSEDAFGVIFNAVGEMTFEVVFDVSCEAAT